MPIARSRRADAPPFAPYGPIGAPVVVSAGAPVTALSFLIGDRSLIVGQADRTVVGRNLLSPEVLAEVAGDLDNLRPGVGRRRGLAARRHSSRAP